MSEKELIEWIADNSSKKVAEFTSSLIPTLKYKVYGVKLPLLAQKAREFIYNSDDIGCGSFEEILLKGYAIGYLKDVKEQLRYIRKFVKLIDNWAVCDSFCSALKLAKKHQEVFWKLVKKYSTSKADYEQRFAYVMMLRYFCNKVYLYEMLNILVNARPKIRDTKQAVAWTMAECFIKYQKETTPYLYKLRPEIFRLTRRKILDSKRVDSATKFLIKSENLFVPCE